MTRYSLPLMCDELMRDEGCESKPYRDTVGKLTIGCGFNLDDVGLYPEEIQAILRNRIMRFEAELDREFPWWKAMSDARQRALLNMTYNLGIARLKGFARMLAALQTGDYETAAREALNSQWATQVGARAQRIAEMIRVG